MFYGQNAALQAQYNYVSGSSFSSCCLEMNPVVNLDVDLPEEGVQMMLSHINLLHDIR